ncbi:alginate lyase family protein [Streptomyces sp. NBC_01262]|uniref:alginate lyase family protein n=1 Tax=Streptomyces sp. NBC_01262 TaxID=2903803 RepID=UPI002E341459|nr:alginate lyase family protein [Streptomyces sp. NBC_01262]
MRGPRTIRLARAVLLIPLLVPLLMAGPAAARAAAHAVAPQGFRHPGVLLDRGQLDIIRRRVHAGQQPWASAFEAMRASRYGQTGYTPHPRDVVVCPWDNGPSNGCADEREDALAAYTQALLWSVTQDRTHAEAAIRIMDAWSGTLKDHTEGDAGLQAAWAGASWARAAEIIRWTYHEWPQWGVERFSDMLRNVYLPELEGGAPDYNGNWDLTMEDAATGIAVFLDDRHAFDEAIGRFRERVRAYFHLESDGPVPPAPPGSSIRTPDQIAAYWYGQREYPDGIAQETCRNFKHVGYSLAATAHVAETAFHQGLDLWSEIHDRVRAALEFHTRYELGEPVPGWLCGGHVELGLGPVTEVAVNHLRHRLGMEMPQTLLYTARQRPEGTNDLFVAWETLTHADNPGW